MIPAASSARMTPAAPCARPRATSAASSTSSVQVSAEQMWTTSGRIPAKAVTATYSGNSVV
jgi:hypothetical protein